MFPFHNLFKHATVCSLLQTSVRSWVPQLDYLATHSSLSPIRCGFTLGFLHYKKECTRIAAASDKVYQLLAHGRWFAPGTPASSTTKWGRHHITGILLKVTLIHQQTLVQDGSVAIIRHSFSLTVRYSDRPLVQRSDSDVFGFHIHGTSTNSNKVKIRRNT